ncbi:MAG: hypothetical protein GQ527_12700 [Bacteroidales bacterium]|nr:hypothetical protein [Bacteroidales bacterium]
MKKRTGIIIIILTGLSILGVIITQIFWIENAYKLKKEQFEDKVKVSLKTVVNSLYSLKNNQDINAHIFDPSCRPVLSDSDQSLDLNLLDSLLSHELQCIRISKDYFYGVYLEHDSGKEMKGGVLGIYQEDILISDDRVSLSCLYNYSDPYYLAVYFPFESQIITKQMIGGFFISAFFVLIIGFSFIYIIYVTFRQKRISQIKNDFVNNMTHEFKTPISTVSLTAEMLLQDKILEDLPKARKYAKVIYDENQRLKLLVEQVLQIAVIDKGEYTLRKKDVDVHKVIHGLIPQLEIPVNARGGVVKTYFAANYPKIWADKMHFTNIISNLLDNANKYTPESPVVVVRTKNVKNGVLVSIEDNGIGIKSENQKDIFRQFHRVHTGNIHDVKGFGLGLFYVSMMTDAHGGHIKLSSEWGKGSTFEVFFPFNIDEN